MQTSGGRAGWVAAAAAAAVAVAWIAWPRDPGPAGSAGATQGSARGAVAAGGPGAGPGGSPARGSDAARRSTSPADLALEGAPGSTPPVEVAAVAQDGFVELKVTAQGKPAAGAAVRLYLKGPTDPSTSLPAWRLAGAGTSGKDGLLRLPARPGTYLAAARAEGFAPALRELRRPLGEPITRAALELQPGAALAGRTVARGSGEPVPLASIALSRHTTTPGPLGFRGRAEVPAEELVRATSDAKGAFQVAGLAPGEWQVEAHAPGSGRGLAASVRVPRRDELVLELPAASFVEGHVLGADGKPAAGAEVWAVGGREPAVTTTSEKGAFSLEVEPRSWLLSARKGTEAGALGKPVAVLAGQTAGGLEIRLAAGSAIAGTVVSAATQKPLAGARVDVSPHGQEGDLGRTVTGPDGAFALEGLAPGSYDVAVSLDGWQRELRRGVTVLQGQRFPLRVELAGTGRVEGRVVDSHAGPVEGALVTASRGGPGIRLGGAEQPEARTGPDGRYVLAGVAPGRALVSARRDGAALGGQLRVEVVEGGVTPADFTLVDDGAVAGRVTRKSGSLPEGVMVRVVRAQPSMESSDFASAPAAPDGTYRLQLPPGAYRIGAGAGRAGLGGMRDTLTVEPGRTTAKDLALPDEGDDQGALTITVLEPGGAPSPGAMVRVTSSQAGMRFAMMSAADEQGRFQLTRPKDELPDVLDVRATAGGRTGTAKVPREQAQVTLQLQPAARVEGRVNGADPAGTFRLSVDAADDREPGVLVVGSGAEREFTGDRFSLDDVSPGPSTLTVRTRDGRTGKAQAALLSGQTAQVEVTLEQEPTLAGRVVDAEGKPVADVRLLIDGQPQQETSGADGRFVVTGLSPGEHRVGGLLPPLRSLPERKATLQAGQRLDLGDLVLPAPKTPPGSIGAMLRPDPEGATVMGLIPGGPAEKAGLAVGDMITAVDGKPLQGDVRAQVNGPPGSQVTLTVVHAGANRPVTLARAL